MEARRITARPNNSVKMLVRREISSRRERCFSMRNSQERFRSIFLQEEYEFFSQEEYDTQITMGQSSIALPFLRRPTKVTEIVSARRIVFALVQSGVCAAFSRETNQRLCFLNVTSDEVIKSIFYNKYNDSVITASVFESDNFSSLICKSRGIEYIQSGQPDAGFTLFESESLKWPSSVGFDDINAKVLTLCSQTSIYKVFDLRNYKMLYSISDKDVKEIKTSPDGTMLLIYTKVSSHVPLKILSIEDGSVLQSFNHLLHRNRRVEFIQPFNEKLLVKQKNEKLQILDVQTSELIEVGETEFLTQPKFFFLHENPFFMTFRNQRVDVWNFKGQLLTFFEDHLPWHPNSNTKNLHITRDQDLIISYCKDDLNGRRQSGGSINISNILTGKCLVKINAGNTLMLKECMCSGRRCNLSRPIQLNEIISTVAQALEGVTALFYDEELNEIYTGNQSGLLHVWSS